MSANITFVIRTYNSSRTLPALLAKIQKNDVALVCVDSGSTDGTLDIIRQSGALLRELPFEQFSFGRSLNLGFEAANTEWVVVISSHCLPLLDTFVEDYQRLVATVEPRIVAVSGQVIHNRKSVRLGTDLIVATGLEVAAFDAYYVGNPNCAYRRSVWAETCFDERVRANEDLIWIQAALARGQQVAVSFAVPVWYHNPIGIWAALKKGWHEGKQQALSASYWDRLEIQNKRNFHRILQKLAILVGQKGASRWFRK